MSNYLKTAMFEHQFWLQVLADHSRFIHDSLYPSQKEDIAKADGFIKHFDQLLKQVKTLDDQTAVTFSEAVETEVKQLKEFKLSIIRRHLTGEMKIHLTPSFINHMVNELEEYERVLSYLNQGKTPPIFHELHHHLLWLLDASGHAGAINDRMDAVEKRLKEKSAAFTKHFEQFYLKALELTGFLRTNLDKFPALKRFNREVKVEMGLFKTFLRELEEMELSSEVLDIFTVSMADHMLREEQYYLIKLAQSAERSGN
ncbi:hypothetical protein CD32_03555 [Lysinibacillus odysseyi 34hs-1 = NBRC 100172]|uniref:DUF2935 domain-containing protein n=2 Tax=Lysinibacillus odysseyi TaxID=202611 RepID=A0A0A3JK71_9BACI|nr:DUF2935 domain-containing protein [Lysinibacillus odysseyi]KGR87387.1 hypothetical protein CD32_03555 [Lysinibacillus odysseyi 34hs-1 = NBRC 100172]